MSCSVFRYERSSGRLPFAERFQVGQILVPANGPLVSPELSEADECDGDAPELTRGPPAPRLLPGYPRDAGQEIDANGRHTELNDDIGPLEILCR